MTGVYAIRPATEGDVDQIAKIVYARALWLRDRGDADWEGFHHHAPVYTMQAADPEVPVWALTRDDGRAVGVITILDECPPFLFTEDERAEPSIFLATTVTDPDLPANASAA